MQVLSWLEKNVKVVIERVSNGDPLVKECSEKYVNNLSVLINAFHN